MFGKKYYGLKGFSLNLAIGTIAGLGESKLNHMTENVHN